MRAAMDETERRRGIQDAYNQEHGIVPKTIIKGVRDVLEISKSAESENARGRKKKKLSDQERAAEIAKLEKEIDGLEAQLRGGGRRKAVGVVPRDW